MQWLVGFVIGLVALGTTVEAGNGRGTSQKQGQVQLQAQGQGQGQSSVGSVEVSGDNFPKEKTLLKGSMAFSTPPGNDGLGIVTPYGGPMITGKSRMDVLKVASELGLGTDEDYGAEFKEWVHEAAKPHEFLGINGTSRGCRNWLVKLLCL